MIFYFLTIIKRQQEVENELWNEANRTKNPNVYAIEKRTKKITKLREDYTAIYIIERKKFGNYLIEKYLREKKQHLSIV